MESAYPNFGAPKLGDPQFWGLQIRVCTIATKFFEIENSDTLAQFHTPGLFVLMESQTFGRIRELEPNSEPFPRNSIVPPLNTERGSPPQFSLAKPLNFSGTARNSAPIRQLGQEFAIFAEFN